MYEDVFKKLLKRQPDSNKYDYGHVLVIGGSPGMVGAPFLSAEAALRTGAGLVTIASSSAVIDKLEKRIVEIMTLAYSNDQELEDFIRERKVSVIVIGPGMKPGDVPLKIITKQKLPIIIDGGGLAAIASKIKSATFIKPGRILTPHMGEFQRFFDEKLPKNRQELKPIAKKFATDHNLTLVLKGEPTYVAHPDGRLYENKSGTPALATAGTGDVLTGIIAAVIAQGAELTKAVEAAVYLHGLAGELAAQSKTVPGVIASDVISNIPMAMTNIDKGPARILEV